MKNIIILTIYGQLNNYASTLATEEDAVHYFYDMKIMTESLRISYSKVGKIMCSDSDGDFYIFLEKKDGQVLRIGHMENQTIPEISEIIETAEHL